MRTLKLLLACLVAAAMAPTSARAADTANVDDPYRPTLMSTYGVAGEIGGGVFRFIDTKATDPTGTGGDWTARLIFGTRMHVGGELAYVGAALPMNTLGVDDNAILMSNGVQANLRLNLFTGAWQPYAAAGLGWRHYNVVNTANNNSDIKSTDDVAEVPVAIGLAWRYRGFIADARGGVNVAPSSKVIPDANTSSWAVNAKLGFEF